MPDLCLYFPYIDAMELENIPTAEYKIFLTLTYVTAWNYLFYAKNFDIKKTEKKLQNLSQIGMRGWTLNHVYPVRFNNPRQS